MRMFVNTVRSMIRSEREKRKSHGTNAQSARVACKQGRSVSSTCDTMTCYILPLFMSLLSPLSIACAIAYAYEL